MSLSGIFAVFPGQGSQTVGMAKDLYDSFPIVRQAFEEASDSIRLDLRKLCFEGPISELTLTENTQPCLLTASVATFRVAQKEFGFTPGAAAGHSLGEFSALVAMEVLNLGVAVQWVRERGAAMQKAVPPGEGGMAAILGLEDALIDQLCFQATAIAGQKRQIAGADQYSVGAMVEPANYNAPGQVVIAGSIDAIREATQLLKEGGPFAGGKAIPLQVSSPFHCRLMMPAREKLSELFSKATAAQRPTRLPYPYVPNRTGRLNHDADLVFELLVEQVDHPVLWKQSVESLIKADFHAAIEFGPGKVLTGLIKRISNQAGKPCILASVSDTSSIKTIETFLKEVEKAAQKRAETQGEHRL